VAVAVVIGEAPGAEVDHKMEDLTTLADLRVVASRTPANHNSVDPEMEADRHMGDLEIQVNHGLEISETETNQEAR